MSSFYDLAIGGTYQPYFIQSYQELGNYGYDLSYVKNRIQETGSTAQFVITDEQALTAYKDAVFNSEMMNKIKEKELVGPKINRFLKSTDCDMILIYGDADPWYAIRPDDVTNNPHIKIYVNEKLPHSAGVSNFDSKTRTEILNYIHSLID